jgi:hypothetical protein
VKQHFKSSRKSYNDAESKNREWKEVAVELGVHGKLI